MPLRFRRRILDHLAHATYRPMTERDLERQMQVPEDDRDAFRVAIEQLVAAEQLEVGSDERLRLPSYGDEATGVIRVTTRGFGFLIPDRPMRDGDLFIPEGSTKDALSGDRVRVRVVRRASAQRRGRGVVGSRDASRERGELTGRVVEILERGQTRFAGVLRHSGRTWLVEPDGRRLRDRVVVRDPFAKNERAKDGDKVIVEITQWGDESGLPEGVIVRTLGEAGRPDVETEAVIAAHQIRVEFPEEALDEASRAAREFDRHASGPWRERLDLTTSHRTFTIDPPDARDFDDAISIRHAPDGPEPWELGVHIADVSHFVPLGGPLDTEAQARGTSVYLPRRVIPMLPESLSNGVCSLQEGVARYTKSVFVAFDEKGQVVSQRVAASVIRSAKRLTYVEAQALVDGDLGKARSHAKAEPNYPDWLVGALRDCDRLAKVLRERRRRDGMISLSLPQSELVFDDEGHVVDAVPEDASFSHTLIEMFMVEANDAVARLFADLELPLLRRIHPEPAYGDVEELRTYARLAKVDLPDQPTRKDLQYLVEKTANSESARAIHFAVLRSLSKASYSPALIGHFALASDHYAHFTSPIRRYPDLLVHRALQAYLDATANGTDPPGGKRRRRLASQLAADPRVIDEGVLVDVGNQSTEREIAAEEAERELRTFLILQMLADRHLGDDLPAIVTGVAPNGTVFASLEKYLVDGAIPSRALSEGDERRAERWVPVAATGRLVASRSGASIGLGDRITVRIEGIDLAARQMTLRVVRFAESADQLAADLPTEDVRRNDRGGKGRKGRIDGHKRGFKQGRRGKRSR